MLSITNAILVVTGIVSFIAFQNPKLQDDLMFWPAMIRERKQYYRFLTGAFVHADIPHLFFNTLALYSFGNYVESYIFSYPLLFGSYSKIFYLVLYLTGIVFAVIPDYFMHRNNFSYRSLGASGAVSAVVFSGILLRPLMPVNMFLIPLDIPGFIFAGIFLILCVVLAKYGRTNVAHGAHFSGAIYGILFTTITTKIFADYNAIKTFIHILRFDWIL